MRGQVSVEFLIITALSLAVLTASSFAVYSFIQDSSTEAVYGQVESIGNALIQQARNVRVYGESSFVNVEASAPDGFRDITIVEGGLSARDVLVFHLDLPTGSVSIPFISDVNLGGIDYTPLDPEGSVSNALKPDQIVGSNLRLRLTSKGSYVEVSVR